MTAENYVALAYAIGLALMWGYAAYLWTQSRAQRRREIDAARVKIRADVVAAWSRLVAARAQIESDEAQVRANQIALNGVREEEKVGQRTILDVLDAEQEMPEEAGDADGVTHDPEELHALLTDARSKADQHWDQCLRLQADMENLRKRNERDLANAHKFALEKFANALLPVKDSLEMGLLAAVENADVAKLVEGSELTLKMLTSAMEKFNVSEVNPLNEKFNPEYHEAMSMQERDDVAPNTVVTVVQKGYTLNDRLIRPAMVIVSRGGAAQQINEQA